MTEIKSLLLFSSVTTNSKIFANVFYEDVCKELIVGDNVPSNVS